MTDIRYDIGKIFKAAFGISSPIYITQPISYSGVNVLAEEEAKQLSWLGTPIMFPIRFSPGSYKVYDMFGRLVNRELSEFTLPAATLVEFSRAKNITRTEVLGNNGTVKEIFGFDDWHIRMRGVCLPEPNRTEQSQKEALLAWEQVAGAIDVDGKLFSEKGITRMVITYVNFPQVQAKPKVIPFEIYAISDEPIEIAIEKQKRGYIDVGDLEVIGVNL